MDQPILIRNAVATDGVAVASLMNVLGYDLCAKSASDQIDLYKQAAASAAFIAEINSDVVGVIAGHLIPLFHESGNLGRITALAVAERARRQGIASLLLERLEKWFSEGDCLRYEVTSGDHREGAHDFYCARSYRCDERRFVKLHRPCPT